MLNLYFTFIKEISLHFFYIFIINIKKQNNERNNQNESIGWFNY
jgi:hypothetical protein